MSQVDRDVAKSEAKRRIHNLVEDYMRVLAAGKKESFNEERVKIAYVVPFLEALGWNPRTDEVLPEQATLTGRADFGLRVGGRTKIFVEMKSFNKSLDGYDTVKGRHRSYAQQAIQYAWSMKADWAVLTNFEEMRLYDSRVKKPEDGLVWKKSIRFTEFESRFDELWLISKESVVSGTLDAYRAKVERPSVDEAFLGDLMNCRQLLAEDIQKNNPELTYDQINESVQKILDRLIFIKNCEDRLIIPAESLWKRFKAWQETAIDKEIVIFMLDLKNLFRYFDQVYNGKLFEKHPCEDLKINNQVFEEIIDTLYGDGQHLGYNFSIVPVDVLGQAYELYIGSIIKEKEGQAEAIRIVKEPRKRKAYGIYYTPEHVVNYIVDSTLVEFLENCRTPEDVSKVKVLDPACGSGSFLIRCFDAIKKWYSDYNEKNRPTAARDTLDAHFISIPNVEERILTENLYGVDLDPQAVEIAILNLSLKGVKPKERLPYIGDHIKCGDSLISGSRAELANFFEKPEETSVFNWEQEFPEIFDQNGFNIVIGNPPYVSFGGRWVGKISSMLDSFLRSEYPNSAEYKLSTYAIFVNRAIGLLGENGLMGFILPDSFLLGRYFSKLRRYILDNTKIRTILLILEDFWPAGTVGRSVIMVLQKELDKTARQRNKMKIVSCPTLEDLANRELTTNFYDQEYFETTTRNRFRLFFDKSTKELIDKLERLHPTKFGDVISFYSGIRSKVSINKITSKKKIDDKWERGLISGGQIGRYRLNYNGDFIFVHKNLDILWGGFNRDRYEQEKLFMRKTGDGIIATYDDGFLFCLDHLHTISMMKEDSHSLKYTLALLNSKLLNYVHRAISLEFKRAMAQIDTDMIKDLPFRKIDFDRAGERLKHDRLVDLVDEILHLNMQLDKIEPSFKRYLTEPVVDYMNFRKYYNELTVSEKEPLDISAKGNITKLKVGEDGSWLTFRVDFVMKEARSKKRVKDFEVLRCKFDDDLLRKFLLNIFGSYRKPLGTGNLLHKILALKIPCFHRSPDKNKQIIDEMMRKYLWSTERRRQLENQIRDVDNLIDEGVYELYGLDEKEVLIVEKSLT